MRALKIKHEIKIDQFTFSMHVRTMSYCAELIQKVIFVVVFIIFFQKDKIIIVFTVNL